MEVISFFVVFRKWLFKQSTTYRGNWAHLVHFHPPTPPPLSFFPHLPPSYSAWGRTMSGWSEPLLTQCSPSVTILVAGEGNGIKLPNWAIKGYFCPCMPVSVGSCSKYRSGTSDANETCPPFHWFKSTYVIPSSDQQELAIPYHLGLILQLSLPVITLLPTQSCPVFYFFFFLFFFLPLEVRCMRVKVGVWVKGAMCFHLVDDTVPRKALWVWPTSILPFQCTVTGGRWQICRWLCVRYKHK